MNTTSDFLYLVGGLVVAALIVSFGFFIFTNNKETANSAIEQTNKLNTQLQESEWMQYDGVEITGSEVLNVIKHFQGGDTYVAVDDDYYIWDSTLSTPSELKVAEAKKRGGGENGEKYIVPSAMYLGEVKYITDGDATSGIAGISFTKQ